MAPPTPSFGFDNTYRRLPGNFYSELGPVPTAAPRLVALNRALADDLGLDPEMLEPHAAAIFSGNLVPDGAEPVALAYAGHQFGSFVPQLGDGRAILLGEVVDRNGQRRDIQLKGSGQTPFSRLGDGRAALGPMLREYLVSEAMHALGIPTTRSLAVVTTGERVYRDTVLPGAVLTRVAASHIRIGTFQYFAAQGDAESVRLLADYVIARHYPELSDTPERYLALLEAVIDRQASLIARWLHVAFIHGVMNTDNMAISGETIDYGPCAFMDRYDPATVFSSIDRAGRYAYGNQPGIAQWNLARLAETLLRLIDPDTDRAVSAATALIQQFPERFQRYWLDGMRRKLGLATNEPEDRALVDQLLDAMYEGTADFTLSFRRLSDAAGSPQALDRVRSLFEVREPFDAWASRWEQRLQRDPQSPEQRAALMRTVNPAVIPRNHRVEEALEAAVGQGDFRPFDALFERLQHPYDDLPAGSPDAEPPPPPDRGYRTFCGT
jgi:uncharacterized protein YdiU (UPF0061 family)